MSKIPKNFNFYLKVFIKYENMKDLKNLKKQTIHPNTIIILHINHSNHQLVIFAVTYGIKDCRKLIREVRQTPKPRGVMTLTFPDFSTLSLSVTTFIYIYKQCIFHRNDPFVVFYGQLQLILGHFSRKCMRWKLRD